MPPFGRQSSQRRQAPPAVTLDFTDHFTFLENCPPTSSLSQHLYLPGAIGSCTYLSLKAKCWLGGGGRWAVSQKGKRSDFTADCKQDGLHETKFTFICFKHESFALLLLKVLLLTYKHKSILSFF